MVKNETNKPTNNKEYHKQLKEYEQWLLKLGEATLPSAKIEEKTCPDSDVIEISHDMFWESKEETIGEVFEDFEANVGNSEYSQSRVPLAATTQIINDVNNKMVDRMPGNLHCFTSDDTVDGLDDTIMFPTESLNTLCF